MYIDISRLECDISVLWKEIKKLICSMNTVFFLDQELLYINVLHVFFCCTSDCILKFNVSGWNVADLITGYKRYGKLLNFYLEFWKKKSDCMLFKKWNKIVLIVSRVYFAFVCAHFVSYPFELSRVPLVSWKVSLFI